MPTAMENSYFLDQAHRRLVWFVSYAFKQEDEHLEKLALVIRHIAEQYIHFTSSPIIGLTLLRCVQKSRQDIILCLLSEGVDVNRTFRGRCMLHEAVKICNEVMLSFLLALPGVDKNMFDADMRTPLMEAARGRPRCLKLLLEAGCDWKLTDPFGNSAFHHTFQTEHKRKDDILACLDTLLEHGADINSRGSEGKTCLQRAVEMGNHWQIKWLILHNCDLNVQLRSPRVQLDQFQAWRFHKEIPLLIAIKMADRVVVEVMIACSCEYRQYNYSWVLDYCKHYRLLYDSLTSAFSSVDSLQTACRKVIRNCLSFNIVAEVQQLQLPYNLQQYVLCREELQTLDQGCT